jgi:hypothetical protein
MQRAVTRFGNSQNNERRILKVTQRVASAMSVVRDLILQADDQLRYPSGGELRSMVEYLSGGAMRLAVVRARSPAPAPENAALLERARALVLALFEAVGAAHPAVVAGRKTLSKILFR